MNKDNLEKFLNDWFHCVAAGGTGDEQAVFHLHRDARIFTGSGMTFSLDEHHALHQKWKNEKHILGTYTTTVVNDAPERVRVDATVYWQAQNKNASDDALIKMVVGESWIIEDTADGLKFVLYLSSTFQMLPDSAVPDFS